MRVDAIAFRSMEDQASPSATNVKKALKRLQAKLSADQVELLCLGQVKRLACISEVGAGVGERSAQPWAEKLHGLVVVIGNGGTVSSQGVLEVVMEPSIRLSNQSIKELLRPLQEVMRPAHEILRYGEDGEKVTFHFDLSMNERFGEGHFIWLGQKVSQNVWGVDD